MSKQSHQLSQISLHGGTSSYIMKVLLIPNLEGFLGVRGRDKNFATRETGFLIVAPLSQLGSNKLSSLPHMLYSRSDKMNCAINSHEFLQEVISAHLFPLSG